MSIDAVRAALDAYAAVLAKIEPTADVLAACRAERDLPQALAAIDLALWDHASRRTETPLAKLIHPLAADEVPSTRRSAPTTVPERRPRRRSPCARASAA